ncbi:2'-5' RNA ligase family protein [Geoglobus acetivorans]
MIEKYRIKRKIQEFKKVYRIRYWHKVPHITLVYNFSPKEGVKNWELANIIKKVASKYNLRDLWFYYDGFEFNKGRNGYVLAFRIEPSQKLRRLRAELYNSLKPHILERPDVVKFNGANEDEFWFHATIGYRLSERDRELLSNYLKTIEDEYFMSYPLRISLLRNSKIAYEYDTATGKILSRQKALSKKTYSEMIKEYRKIFDIESNPPNSNSGIWLISDTHFDHENIIKYCARPFADVREMNRIILRNWNNTIQSSDTVYFLGDMSFGRRSKNPLYWLQKLNGRVKYIYGNHDSIQLGKNQEVVVYRGYKFLLVHDPKNMGNMKKFDGWIIHGHVHNNELRKYPFIDTKKRTINVCVEVINYKPISLDEIVTLIQRNEGGLIYRPC